MASPAETAALTLLHAYLSSGDAPSKKSADVVVGLGHFDRAIPRLCGELVRAGRARWIIFSGGIGAGSGDFTQPEAREFRDELQRHAPDLVACVALLEERSTNTGENLAFTTAALAATRPDLIPGETLRRAWIVATPCRLRRALATARLHWPAVQLWGTCPARTLDEERALYAGLGQDLRAQLVGEVERLVSYPARGFIVPVSVPAEVLAAARTLGAKV